MSIRTAAYYLFISITVSVFYQCKTTKTTMETASSHISVKDFEVDEIGNIYTVSKDNQITKYDITNNRNYHYDNYSSGELAALDVTNPHKIMLFYKDFQQIIILDNTLSVISEIQLSPQWLITAAGYANDGNIWLFDSSTIRFLKINNKGEIVNESFIAKEIANDTISNSKIYDRDNYMYVILGNRKLALYDNQTYFIRTLNLESVAKPSIINNIIYYFSPQRNSIMAFNLKYNEINVIYDFTKNAIKATMAILNTDKIYFYTQQKISGYPQIGQIYIINIKK